MSDYRGYHDDDPFHKKENQWRREKKAEALGLLQQIETPQLALDIIEAVLDRKGSCVHDKRRGFTIHTFVWTTPPAPKLCLTCGGSGIGEHPCDGSPIFPPCPDCAGSGELQLEKRKIRYWEVCPTCGGSGREEGYKETKHEYSLPCSTCKGTGKREEK